MPMSTPGFPTVFFTISIWGLGSPPTLQTTTYEFLGLALTFINTLYAFKPRQ